MNIRSFFVLFLPSLSLITNLLCNPSWCPLSSIGNGICDLSCMVSFCNFDSNSNTNLGLNPENSDCYQKCISDYSCFPSDLGNGICDPSCNNPVCGYDFGDCGYCSSDCKIYLAFKDDLSIACSDSCDNENCYFGYGSCKDCSPGCSREMLGDGICDKSCNFSSCNYDFGDCNNNQCSPGCELWMIGDNNCNRECDNQVCDWDGGDCDCSQDCHSYMKSNGVCDEICDYSSCNYDGGDCQKCAPGCLKSMLGDGICDSACNVNDCHYDNYDCSCADGCNTESYGQCKDSCMNSFCQYDTISETSQCQNTNQILFALHYGLIFKNLIANVSPDNCTSTTSCLSTEVLDSSTCNSNCKGASCIYAWNNCEANTCADPNCLICNSNGLGDCFKCNSNTYQFYGYCLASCPGGHETINLLGDYPVCLIPKDYSTKDNPAVYYVTSKTSTDIYEGNGSFSNPFASISLALASIYNKYAIIYLLNDGDHYFTCVSTSNPISTVLSDVCDPLSKSFSLTNLVITSYDGSMIVVKTKADHNIFSFTIPSTTTLTIKNVLFNGQDVLSTCTSEANPYCSYCADITLSSDGKYYNDQGTVVSNYLDSAICDTFHTKSLFSLYLGSNLLIENVNFTDWRMELKTLITSYGANILFTNVNFDNIRCMWGVTATQPGQLTPQQEKNSVIYFLDCEDQNYNCGSFEYINGVVSRLNNGYEYGAAQFSGFLSADKIRTVKLKNVTFVNNVVYSPSIASTTYSLIKITIYRSIEISDCIFEKNIANYGLIYLEPLNLAFRNDINSNNELIDLLLYHIYMHDSIFKNNYGIYAGILWVAYQSQLQKILLENLTINENGVLAGPLVYINNLYYSSQYLVDTSIAITDLNGNAIEAIYKKRDFIFKNSIITNNYSGLYGIFDITQLVNIRFYNLTVESNGSLETQNINTILWNYYVEDSDLYIKSLVTDSNGIDCFSLWSIRSSYNHEILKSSFKNNVCQNSCPSLRFETSENINITDCSFERNMGSSSSYGICVYSFIGGNMKITNSLFNDNKNNAPGGFGPLCFSQNLGDIYISNTMISNNSADYSSGLYFTGGSLMMNNVTFESNIASSGLGTLYFSVFPGAETHKIDIKNSLFKNNKSSNIKGGAIYVSSTSLSQDEISLSITDTKFKYNSAQIGSAIYIENNVVLKADSIIENCIFAFNTADDKGTIANFFQFGILNISNSLFVSNYAYLGSALYFASSEQSSSDKSKMVLTSCNFTENSGQNVLCAENIAILSYIETTKCIFEKNEGPAIYLAHGYWKDTESIIANSTTNAGAVSLTSYSTAHCELTSFINNTSANIAGAIRAEGSSYFHCNKCMFYKNSAKYGGVFYFNQLSYFFIENSIFKNNFCKEKGAVVYVIRSKNYSILRNSQLYHNHAESEGLIYSIASNIKIDSCEIYENTANGITPGIYFTLSNFTIASTQFKDHKGHSGSFLYLASDNWLSVENSTFLNGKSLTSGGSIYTLSSSINMSDSLFMNSSSSSGNVMLAFSTSLNISQCKFLNTYSSSFGGVINHFGSSIFIQNSLFENFTYSAIDGSEMESLKIIKTSFKNSQGKVGGIISCTNTDYVYINSCVFYNGTSIYGGALYFIFTDNTINSKNYEIISTEFVNNTSSAGGAIYLDNINADIKSCRFYGNKALEVNQSSETTHSSGIGGAMKLGCSYSGECTFNVFSNEFVENIADYEGGAIVWRDVMPNFESNSFGSNKAEYGENIASYSVSMKIMNTNWNGWLNDLASGQLSTTPLIIGLIDHLGSVVTTDDSSVGELISLSQDVILSGELKVTASSGIFNFSSFIISAEPGSNFSIEIQTDGIDNLKSIKANDGLTYNSSLLVEVTLRNCVLGEITVGVKCIICPEDLYSLNPKSDQCLICPNEAICYGNYTIVPKPGYWRSSMLTDTFWSCPNKDACIGSNLQNISYTGNCLEGYTGNLCQSCSEDYAKITKNQCAKCQSLSIIIIKTCGIGIGYIIVCWVMVKMSKKSAYKPKSLTSVYIKILVNYIQLAMITTTFSLSWPSYVKQLFSAQNNGSFIGEQIFSFDCLLYYSGDLRGGRPVIFYQKLFFMALLPISIPIISAIIWSLISYCKRNFSLFADNIITSSIVAAFFVYPSLIKYYFSSFDCKELDYGEYWLEVDLSLRCWDSQHTFYITAISFPAILLWGIGIPATCLLLIKKNKHRLSSIDVRIKYGFLFNGYKSRSYYWEFVIIYRKIVIICCSIFLSAVSVSIQALTTLFVLAVYLYFQCKIKPYNGDDLNKLEIISIASSAITIYCGMYYLSESLDQFTEMLFFIIIISVNAYFIIYWIIKAGNAYIAIIVEKIPFLRKKFHHENYQKNALGDDKGNKIGEISYELILKSSQSENLNHQGIDFKEIKMRDLFLANLKGGMPVIYEEIERDSIEYSYMEKKSIGGIITEENSFEENNFRLSNTKGINYEEKFMGEVKKQE